MANVVRFALSTAKTLFVPGAGTFIGGILDVDANNLALLTKTRYLVQPYRAVELGTVDAATPKPSLPAVPGPPAPDPYPQYLTPAEAVALPELRAAFGHFAPAPSGSDDTVALQAALTAAAGKPIHLRAGANYIVSSPLIVSSRTVINGNGATLTLTAGANTNLIRNASYAPQRTMTGSAVTGNTLTGTGLTSADVGRAVIVPGAGAGGTPWGARIAAVADATTATLDDTAGTNVTGATITVHDIDTDITIRDLTVDRGANAGTGNALHSILLRHVDRLHLEGIRGLSTAGKYAIFIGDARAVSAERLRFRTASDGIHFIGPIKAATVRDVRGFTGDNTVAFGTGDYVTYQDMSGPISGITIADVEMDDGNNEPIRIFNIQGGPLIRDVHIDGLRGASSVSGITIGTADTGTTGNITGVKIRNVSIEPATNYGQVYLNGTAIGDVQIDGLSLNVAATTTRSAVMTGPAAIIDTLTIDRVTHSAAGKYRIFQHNGTAQVRRLTMTNINVSLDATKADGRISNCSGQVDVFLLSNIHMRNGADFVFHNNVNKTIFFIDNVDLNGPANGVQIQGAIAHDLYLSNVRSSVNSGSGLVRLAGASVSGSFIRANAVAISSGTLVSRSSTQTVRVNSLGAPIDLAVVAGQSTGDLANNSNAGLACGVGAAMWTGTAWVNLATSASYTP